MTSHLENCVIECSKTQGCLSINSYNAANAIYCELNKSNRYGSQANLIKTSFGWDYLEMVFNPDLPDACLQKDGWYRSKTAAYKFINKPTDALEARQRCQNMSAAADLVSFVDKEEEEIFEQYLEGVGFKEWFWIGLNDLAEEGTFVWFDGTKSKYTNWGREEPNNGLGGNEHCTIKLQRNGWNDIKCSSRYPFACKTLCT
ncbi:Aggrecan core protein [Exaiptasia diaphana]|nr:Aggrecan core protein [Exaiptasia diaphana]